MSGPFSVEMWGCSDGGFELGSAHDLESLLDYFTIYGVFSFLKSF
jgi:hypothetical protein